MGPLGIMDRPFDTNSESNSCYSVLKVPTTIMLRRSQYLLRNVAPMGKGGIGSARFEAPWPWPAKLEETLGPSTPRASTGLAGRGWCGDGSNHTCPLGHILSKYSTFTLGIPLDK